MRRDAAGGEDESDDYASLMDALTEALLREAEMPPREVKGCSQEFLDGLCGDAVTIERKGLR